MTTATSATTTAAPPRGVQPAKPVLERRVNALLSRGADLRGAFQRRNGSAELTLPAVSAPRWGGAQPGQPVKGIILEGLTPPSLLIDIWRRTPPQPDGFRTPILILHEDEGTALAAMEEPSETIDSIIADERVHWFIGPGASGRLHSFLRSRIDLALPSDYVRSPVLRVAARPSVEEIVRSLHAEQQAEHQRLLTLMRSIYAGRDREWWRRRYDEASSGGHPLRILLPVSRYSTFVRHAASDLAESLREAGLEARLLSEPDDFSRLVAPAYLRAFSEWRPDAVVLINYCRRHMGDAVPANIPFITWVQDRMAHLFDESVGRSLGDLDFVIGHMHRELFDLFCYPKCRRLPWFIPASNRKFRRGTSSAPLLEKHRCEIAYVSHQSETPEAGHARLRAAFAGQPVLLGVVDRLFNDLASAVRAAEPFDGTNRFIIPLLKQALGREPEDRLVNTIAGNYAVPIAERLFRHITLEWTADVATRRGWRFNLYGNGWSDHPKFREYARGPLEHGDDLLAAYRAARVNLHISRNTNAHQRVYECALAGGLMLRRGPSPDAAQARWELIRRLLRRDGRRTPWGDVYIDLVEREFPDPTLFDGLEIRRVGLEQEDRRVWRIRLHESWGRYAAEKISPMRLEMMPDQSLPFAAETMFASPAELEARIERAGDSQWRSEVIERQSQWALEHASYGRLAVDLPAFIRAGLAA